MNLPALAVLYVIVGTGCVVARLSRGTRPRYRISDSILLLSLWPLFGPFLLMHGRPDASEREVEFLFALRRVGDTPLGAALPDAEARAALGARLRVAGVKVREIDRILARPEFDEPHARSRLQAMRERAASETALATASMRVQNIHRLRALRNRFANELDEISELLMQLSTQAEVVRLAGSADCSSRELVQELVMRVEALDSMLDDDSRLLDA